MKKYKKILILTLAIGLFGFCQLIEGQTLYMIGDSKLNDMKLSGTSSLHDWDMNTNLFTGEAQFNFKQDDDQTLVGLNSLSFSLPVTNLKSGDKELDKNAYGTLKTDKYKDITYSLLSAKVSPVKDYKFLIKTIGNLTISGITKEVAMDVHAVINDNGTVTVKGLYKFNMTDYNVEPPSFLWGAMNAGDAVTVDFLIVYEK
jgi:polyisoprenoid-binding protein YceI